jgi:hypothetical protein
MSDSIEQGGRPSRDRLLYGDPIATTLADARLPQVEGVEYEDVSSELDEPLGNRTVEYTSMFAFSDTPQYERAPGRTLREAIDATSAIPLVGPLVIAYHVNAPKGETSKDYLVNGQLIGSPEEAERRRVTRLAEVMRMKLPAKVGVFLPLIPPQSLGQQFMMYPGIVRVVDVKVGVAGLGKFKGEIGVVVGVKETHFSQDAE